MMENLLQDIASGLWIVLACAFSLDSGSGASGLVSCMKK